MKTKILPLSALALASLVGCESSLKGPGDFSPDERPEVGLELPNCPIAFGDVALGSKNSLSLAVRNTGKTDLLVESIDIEGPFTTHRALPFEVPESTSPTLALRFLPETYSDWDQTLTLTYSADGGEAQTLSCTVTAAVIRDLDGDGFDAIAAGGTDCDDANPAIHPDAANPPYDGIDSNCSGLSDWDQDGDGYESWVFNENPKAGGGDCQDVDPNIHPFAVDTPYDGTDSDCLGDDDWDQDGDGHRSAYYGWTDCDDTNAWIHPDASEVFDGRDDDCSGVADDDSLAMDAPLILMGSKSKEWAGQALATGDFDGDGLDDLAIGAPGWASSASGDRGGVAVFFQNSGSLEDGGFPMLDGDSLIEGAEAADSFGSSLATLGDVDGDGADDLAIGAPQASMHGGTVYVFSGADLATAVDPSDATLILLGEDANLGVALSTQTDLNGDGVMDVVAWGASVEAPEVSLAIQLGGSTGEIAWADLDATFRMRCGEVTSGTVTCGLPINSSTKNPDVGGTDSFAWSAGKGQDLDGDGYDDLVAGDKFNDDGAKQAGAAWILWGTTEWKHSDAPLTDAGTVLAMGDTIKQNLGALATAIPDRDGDGLDEVLVQDPSAEAIYIIPGSHSLREGPIDLAAMAMLTLTDVGENLRGVSVIGDWDGDGKSELLLSFTDPGATDGGEVLVLPSALVLGEQRLSHAAPASIAGDADSFAFGAGLDAATGDLDGDGKIDLVTADPSHDDGRGSEGAIFVFWNEL